MLNATMEYVHVCQSIRVILMLDADLNVFSVQTVQETEHVSEISVLTHVQVHVAKEQSVM